MCLRPKHLDLQDRAAIATLGGAIGGLPVLKVLQESDAKTKTWTATSDWWFFGVDAKYLILHSRDSGGISHMHYLRLMQCRPSAVQFKTM